MCHWLWRCILPDETLAPSDRINTSAITEQRQDVDENLKIAFSVYYHNMMVACMSSSCFSIFYTDWNRQLFYLLFNYQMTRACQNVIFPLSHGKNMIWRRGTQQYQDQVVLRETFEGGVKLSSNDNLLFLKILFANNTLYNSKALGNFITIQLLIVILEKKQE